MLRSLALLIPLALVRCSLPSQTSDAATTVPTQTASSAVAAAWDPDGERILAVVESEGRCVLHRMSASGGDAEVVGDLPFCPAAIDQLGDGTLLLSGSGGAAFWPAVPLNGRLLTAASRSEYLVERDGGLVKVAAGHEAALQRVPGLRAPVMTAGGMVIAIGTSGTGENIYRIEEGAAPRELLTAPLEHIDSFALSPDGTEMVLSALRGTNYDVAIASLEGGSPRWIAPDPSDEVMVSWAPRGHKVSWVLRTPAATLIRTVHVPTSFQLTVDLGAADVGSIAWEPKAEKIAVVLSSPGAAPHVETMRYGGEDRRIVLPPSKTAAISLDVLPGTRFYLAAPPVVRYGRSYPLVVWGGDARPFAWNAVAGKVADATGGALVVGGPEAADLDQKFWDAIGELSWVDRNRVYVIWSGRPGSGPGAEQLHGARMLAWRPGDPAEAILRQIDDSAGKNGS